MKKVIIKKQYNQIIGFALIFILVILTSCTPKNEALISGSKNEDSIANYLENDIDDSIASIDNDSIANYLENNIEENTKVTKEDIEESKEKKEISESSDINNKENIDAINEDSANILENNNVNIEYDVYKKVDLSEFSKNDNNSLKNHGNGGFIDHINGGILLSDQPCKITIKASVKFEKGSALPNEDIGDALAAFISIGPVRQEIYYADYGDNFFGTFHEIERAQEFYNGSTGKGKIWFSDIGLASLGGSSGYRERLVSNNGEEYIADFLDQDEKEVKIRVTIKDIYYKISRPTGTDTEWDLNQDFSKTEFYDKKSFIMKEFDTNYNYIIRPKYTFTTSENYKKTQIKNISFYYTDNKNVPELCKRIMNDHESNVIPNYSKIGIGFVRGDFKKNDGTISEVDITWDKNTKTITAVDSEGEIAGTIKLDYIKEYKYKKPIENETPGYKKYLLATEKDNNEYNEFIDMHKKQDALNKKIDNLNANILKENEERAIIRGKIIQKIIQFGDYKVKYDVPQFTCKMIPNLLEMVEKSVDGSIKAFCTEFYKTHEGDLTGLYCEYDLPDYSLFNEMARKNYIQIKYSRRREDKYRNIVNKEKITVEINLSIFNYYYNSYWDYGGEPGTQNKFYGTVNGWNSLGYEPRIKNWFYQNIKDISELENAEIGDYIHFGKYSQYSKNSEPENLEWIVLDKKDDKLLITTRHVIDSMSVCSVGNTYTNNFRRIPLNDWLNNDFYNKAFGKNEKRIIDPDKKVFLLSYDDVKRYFPSEKSRQCIATYCARENYCWYSVDPKTVGNCDYFLSTTGINYLDESTSLMYVNYCGEINEAGAIPKSDNIGIRPAMWITAK